MHLLLASYPPGIPMSRRNTCSQGWGPVIVSRLHASSQGWGLEPGATAETAIFGWGLHQQCQHDASLTHAGCQELTVSGYSYL